MREPDVVAEPAEAVEVLERAHAEALEAERLLVVGLREVRVQPHAARAGQLRGLAPSARRLTENGEVGASAIRTIAPGAGSWKRSIAAALAARIASRSSTISSGGSPPLLRPRSIAPRHGWKRSPIARAASISTASRSPAWRGKM